MSDPHTAQLHRRLASESSPECTRCGRRMIYNGTVPDLVNGMGFVDTYTCPFYCSPTLDSSVGLHRVRNGMMMSGMMGGEAERNMRIIRDTAPKPIAYEGWGTGKGRTWSSQSKAVQLGHPSGPVP